MHVWLRRATDPQHVRPYARLALVAIGGFQGVIAVLAWLTIRPPQRTNYYSRYQGAGELVGWIVLGAFLLTLAVAITSAIRARQEKKTGWWTGSAALLVTSLIYGLGTGLLSTWFIEQRIGEGILLGFIAAVFGTLLYSAVERGRLPVLGIVIAVVSAALVALTRIAMVDRIGRWDEGEVLGFALFALVALPLSYLLIHGLLILVSGRSDDSQGILAAPPPFEVRLVEGGLLLHIEAPGLDSAAGVEVDVDVDGLRVTVRAPSRVPPTDGLLFSTRPFGALHTTVVLPQPVKGNADARVENGLISLRLALSEPAPSAS
jgi:HSP20 family molecular chaperone IbpA